MKLVDLLNITEQYTHVNILISEKEVWSTKGNTSLFQFEFLKNIYLSEEKYNKIKPYLNYKVIGVQVVGAAIGTLEIVIFNASEEEEEDA